MKKEDLSREIDNLQNIFALREAVLKVAETAAREPLIYILGEGNRLHQDMATDQIGIFPASFNPLTLAHIALMEDAREIFGLEQILLILDIKNIDKEIFGATLEDRLLMLQILISSIPYYRIGLASHGLFIDKLRALKHTFPHCQVFHFIVGYDTIVRVLDRKYYRDKEAALDELFSQCRFLVANRYDKGREATEGLLKRQENKRYGDRIIPFNIPPRYAFITSTHIRNWVKEGKPLTKLARWIPEEILFFIRHTGLYHPPLVIESEGKKITIDRYNLRTGFIYHLFALNASTHQNIDLKKLIDKAMSNTSLGEQLRRVLAIPFDIIPQRPCIEKKNPHELLGDLTYNRISYSLAQAKIEAQRCLQCAEPPCQPACPDNIPIKHLLGNIAKGEVKKTAEYLEQNHPLAGMTEYLCQTRENYCEAHCRLTTLLGPDAGVAIQEVLRTVLTNVSRETLAVSARRPAGSRLLTDNCLPKVAIVGSGPAGLAAAFGLSQIGYQAHIFERKEKIGGIPRYQIPPFRFQTHQIFKDIERKIESQGIVVSTNVAIERDKSMKGLMKEGYNAIFLATGLVKPTRLDIPGEELPQVMTSVDFFALYHQRGLNHLLNQFLGKRVIITDSGNTAMDTGRFLLRLGAEPIIIHWRDRPRALPKETAAACREGVKFLHRCRPLRFIGDDEENLKDILVIRTEYDSQSKVDYPIPGSEFIVQADYVIHAIGSTPDLRVPGLNLTRQGHVVVDTKTMATSLEGVFAGGDLVEKGNISTAIRDGKKAARSIANYLSGGMENLSKDLNRE